MSTAANDTPPFRYTAALAGQIEARWQDWWDQHKTFQAPNPGEPGFDASRPKQFVLDMFPYPSGAGIHVGHPLGYIATDIYARYLRMTGHNVLHAMGYDSFGLPAEQYAVQTNTHPRVTTEANIANMRRQLRRMGLGHDARRSVSTTDEAYYKWTQWIFLQIYNSWYDPKLGKARPIRELVEQFERGERPTHTGKSWSQTSETARHELLAEHRLAFLAEVPVNWCPMLGTVLANEEVTNDGKSERGNFPVYKRPLKQWMMRITAYADRLLADLDPLAWPEPIKMMQRNWIGRSEGAYVDFDSGKRRIRVFTTRPDTLFGATYMVLSPEHEMVDHLVPEKYGETAFIKAIFPGSEELLARSAGPAAMIAAYRTYAKGRSDDDRTALSKDKTGVFTGAYALNPVNNQRIPIFIADYVLAGYGTGAIMGVPAHDERDAEFAEQFRLPIVEVVKPADGSSPKGCFADDGIAINSPPGEADATKANSINGLTTAEAKKKIGAHLKAIGRGEATVTYKLRDWLFSRQRYWGEPFPIVFDEQGLAHDVPESMLPVKLPEMSNFQPESSDDPNAPPRPPLARAKEWMTAELDLGDGRGPRKFTREANTMPNWAGSCWYYLRYLDPEDASAFVAPEIEKYWMVSKKADGTPHIGGVDLYVGGVEHAVLHLLYARFWHKVLFDLGHVSTPEPFGRLFNQGYIQAAAFTDPRGMYVPADEVVEGEEVQIEVDRLQLPSGEVEPVRRATKYSWKGEPVFYEYGKMGKALKNAVAPDDVCAEYGCDTLRVYEMSMGPLEASKPWNTRDIAGSYRFLQRVWRNLIDEQTGEPRVADESPSPELLRSLHKTIAGVRSDMAGLGFNTVVAKLIELNNELTKAHGPDAKTSSVPRAVAEPLVLMLAPLAPHMAEELWQKLGRNTSIAFAPYPSADLALAADDEIEIPVQVLGKLRGRIKVPAKADNQAYEAAAMACAEVKPHIEGKQIKKVIVVPGKMVNLVVG
ncbi:MAG: leucine--tRNA ligase [Phycisphaerales bacterium]